MKNENNINSDIYCSNCKNKINIENTFCSYCGNVVTVHYENVDNKKNISTSINGNKFINFNNTSFVNNDKKNNNKVKKDGMVQSVIALILFVVFLIPYFIELFFAFTCVDNTGGACVGGGFVVFLGSLLIFLPSLCSFGFGVFAVNRYKKSDKEKKMLRKVFNFLNVISLIITGIFLLLFAIFFIKLWAMT